MKLFKEFKFLKAGKKSIGIIFWPCEDLETNQIGPVITVCLLFFVFSLGIVKDKTTKHKGPTFT